MYFWLQIHAQPIEIFKCLSSLNYSYNHFLAEYNIQLTQALKYKLDWINKKNFMKHTDVNI